MRQAGTNKPKGVRYASQARGASKGIAAPGAEAWSISLGRYVLYIILFAHFVALSGETANLDEIKRIIMWVGGSASVVISFALVATRQTRLPHQLLMITFIALLAAKFISVLMSQEYAQWLGWEEMRNWYAVFGVAFLASVTHFTRRAGLESLLFILILSFVLCSFGALHYVGIFELFVPDELTNDDNFGLIISTLAGQPEMFSLIFNTQFFGNVLVFLLPLAICSMMVFPLFRLSQNAITTALPGDANSPALPKHDEPQPNQFLSQYGLWIGALSLITLLLICFCIPLTYSKITLVSAPFGVLILYFGLPFIARLSPPKLPYWPVLLGFLAINALTLYPFIKHDLESRFSTVETSTDSRLIIWSGAWKMFQESPLVGTGAGTFRIFFPTYRSPDYHMNAISNVTLSAHNWVFDALSQTGILGFGTLLLFISVLAWRLYFTARNSPSKQQRILCVGYLAAITAFLTACLATPVLSWPVGLMGFALLVGIGSGIGSTLWDDTEAPKAPEWHLPVGVLGAVVCALFFTNMYTWSANFFLAAHHHREAVRLGSFSAAVQQSTRPEELNFRAQQYNAGIEQFEKVEELNPTYITSYYRRANYENLLGIIYRTSFSETLKLVGQDGVDQEKLLNAIQNFATSFNKHQQLALDQYRKIQHYAPDYSEIHNNIAILESMTTSFERSVYLVLNNGKEPDEETLIPWRESYERALESIEKATASSNKITVWSLQGNLYEEASLYYPEGNPKREELLAQSAESYLKAAQLPITKATQQQNQKIVEEQTRLAAARKSITNYARAKQWAKAAEACETLLPLYPSISDIAVLGAEAYLQAGNITSAQAFLDQQIRRNPTSPELYLQRFRMAVTNPEFAERAPIKQQISQINKLKELIPNFLTPQQEQALGNSLKQLQVGS